MNTITLSSYAVAALELFEDGLRKIIYCSDRLQEKLELHKLAVINNEHNKAFDRLVKLEWALIDLERKRQAEVARVNAVAKAQRRDGRDATDEQTNTLEVKSAVLFEAHDDYVKKATARGWTV